MWNECFTIFKTLHARYSKWVVTWIECLLILYLNSQIEFYILILGTGDIVFFYTQTEDFLFCVYVSLQHFPTLDDRRVWVAVVYHWKSLDLALPNAEEIVFLAATIPLLFTVDHHHGVFSEVAFPHISERTKREKERMARTSQFLVESCVCQLIAKMQPSYDIAETYLHRQQNNSPPGCARHCAMALWPNRSMPFGQSLHEMAIPNCADRVFL